MLNGCRATLETTLAWCVCVCVCVWVCVCVCVGVCVCVCGCVCGCVGELWGLQGYLEPVGDVSHQSGHKGLVLWRGDDPCRPSIPAHADGAETGGISRYYYSLHGMWFPDIAHSSKFSFESSRHTTRPWEGLAAASGQLHIPRRVIRTLSATSWGAGGLTLGCTCVEHHIREPLSIATGSMGQCPGQAESSAHKDRNSSWIHPWSVLWMNQSSSGALTQLRVTSLQRHGALSTPQVRWSCHSQG